MPNTCTASPYFLHFYSRQSNQNDSELSDSDDNDRSGCYTGVVEPSDGQWIVRYDELGLVQQVEGSALAETLRENACHKGGHLWIGKQVLCDEGDLLWPGVVTSFCPGRLYRPARRQAKARKRQKKRRRVENRHKEHGGKEKNETADT